MKRILSEYGLIIIYFLVVSSLIATFFFLMNNDMKNILPDFAYAKAGTNQVVKDRIKPTIEIEMKVVSLHSQFNALEYAKAYDQEGNDIKNNMITYGEVDTTTKGSYPIRYTVRDSLGVFAERKVIFVVD